MPTVAPASEPTSGLEAFWELERFLSEAGAAGLALAELERGSERRGRELLRLSLQAHLDSRGDGDVGEALLLDAADGPVRLTHKRAHTRSLVTIFGEVQLVRVGYGARGRPSIHPLDAELQLPARSYSYQLCRQLCKGAVLGPFEEAVALIEELTAVKIPKRAADRARVSGRLRRLLCRSCAPQRQALAGARKRPPEQEECGLVTVAIRRQEDHPYGDA